MQLLYHAITNPCNNWKYN